MEPEAVDDKALDQALGETISATLKDIESRDPNALVDKPEEPSEPQPAKPRDETGKFTKAPKPAAPAEKPANEASPGTSEQVAAGVEKPEGATATPALDLNRAPSSWKPAAKAAWNALPEPVRAEIYRREGDFHAGLKDIKENADFGQSIHKVMQPYLVKAVRAPDLSVIDQSSPMSLGQAMSGEAAAQLTRMMQAVVSDGTGTEAQINGVPVAGKTGTAQQGPGQPPHAWFTAFAPAGSPSDAKVAVAVVVEDGGKAGNEAYGGKIAAPIAKRVIQAVLG